MELNTTNTKLAYSIREACDATSIGRTTLFKHIAAKRLRTVRIGGRTLIPAVSLRNFVEGKSDDDS